MPQAPKPKMITIFTRHVTTVANDGSAMISNAIDTENTDVNAVVNSVCTVCSRTTVFVLIPPDGDMRRPFLSYTDR